MESTALKKHRGRPRHQELNFDERRLLRVLITPAQSQFLRLITETEAICEAEVVRTALNNLIQARSERRLI